MTDHVGSKHIFMTFSVHLPVLLNIQLEPKRNQSKRTTTTLNLEAIKQDIENTSFTSLFQINDANEATNKFLDILMSTIKLHTSTINIPCKQRIRKPWITPGILRCMRNRDHMHKEVKSNPNNMTLLLTYKRYRNFCNELVKRLKREYERTEFEKVKNNHKKTWEVIKKVT
jgi:hypothetical protein